MGKSGETVMTFVLITGLIVIGVIVIANLRVIASGQASELEYESADLFLDRVTSAVENSYIYPNDIVKTVTFKSVDEYDFHIHDNIVNIYFPRNGLNLTKTFIISNINVIENRFTTSGNISVILKNRNLYVTNDLRCKVNDGICDPACIMKDICDSDCYNDHTRDACISLCSDINKDKLTDNLDSDDICDLDCYNNYKSGGIYDIDCIESNDGICDPDTHNNVDDYCDSDCKGQNGVCDPDCRTYDPDCHHSGNGLCEPDRRESCVTEEADCNCTMKGIELGISLDCSPDASSDAWGCK